MSAYLFVHFTVESQGGEQVFFSVSRDGLHFQDLNNGKPVLVSRLGDQGVRDPFIVQHPVTKKFHLIATDLCIDRRQNDWYNAVHAGSRDIIFWDSDDLIHWSEPRAITLAPEGAGCAWAPEAIYDEEKQAFLIFFACHTEEGGDAKHRIYAAYTNDFVTFSPTFKYIEREKAIIDTTIVHENGMYYRFSKDETTSRINIDCGPSLSGKFEPIPCPVLSAIDGLEGPECYQLPDGRWCLICDQFKAHKGYLPIIIDDLATAALAVLPEGHYDLGKTLKRHGGVLKISDEACEQLLKAFA